MGQIIWNWLCVAIFPLLAGILIRALLRRRKLAWIFTAAAAALALGLTVWAWTNPVPGNEGPGLLSIQVLCLAVGAAGTGLILRLTRTTV